MFKLRPSTLKVPQANRGVSAAGDHTVWMVRLNAIMAAEEAQHALSSLELIDGQAIHPRLMCKHFRDRVELSIEWRDIIFVPCGGTKRATGEADARRGLEMVD